MNPKTEYAEFVAALTIAIMDRNAKTGKDASRRTAPHLIADAAARLKRQGVTHCRIAEDECNRPEREEGEYAKRYEKCRARIDKVLAELGPGFVGVYGGDPRGCTARVKLPNGMGNDGGNDGERAWCIPGA